MAADQPIYRERARTAADPMVLWSWLMENYIMKMLGEEPRTRELKPPRVSGRPAEDSIYRPFMGKLEEISPELGKPLAPGRRRRQPLSPPYTLE